MKKYVLTVVKLGPAGVIAPIELFVSYKEVQVEDQRLGARIELDDFIDALVEGVGKPTLLMSKEKLAAKIKAVSNKIVFDIKNEVSRVA